MKSCPFQWCPFIYWIYVHHLGYVASSAQQGKFNRLDHIDFKFIFHFNFKRFQGYLLSEFLTVIYSFVEKMFRIQMDVFKMFSSTHLRNTVDLWICVCVCVHLSNSVCECCEWKKYSLKSAYFKWNMNHMRQRRNIVACRLNNIQNSPDNCLYSLKLKHSQKKLKKKRSRTLQRCKLTNVCIAKNYFSSY